MMAFLPMERAIWQYRNGGGQAVAVDARSMSFPSLTSSDFNAAGWAPNGIRPTTFREYKVHETVAAYRSGGRARINDELYNYDWDGDRLLRSIAGAIKEFQNWAGNPFRPGEEFGIFYACSVSVNWEKA